VSTEVEEEVCLDRDLVATQVENIRPDRRDLPLQRRGRGHVWGVAVDQPPARRGGQVAPVDLAAGHQR
jgi:hypothetical protein